MMKIAFAVAAAAAVLTTAPLVTPAKAQGVKMAQGVDVQIGRDRDDRYDRDRRGRYDSDTTVGLGPGGVTIGPRQRCRMETTTIVNNCLSMRLDAPYRSGPSKTWLKSKTPLSEVVRRPHENAGFLWTRDDPLAKQW